uniref:RING-type domain-containing protein n=1 Tax=Arcella intermedia TaxID=1963864 RepID=A0A6B2LGW2_9EUKA
MGNNIIFKKDLLDAKLLKPNGIYSMDKIKWDLKTMKKLVVDKKVAPFHPGEDAPKSELYEECPICMFYYPGGLNRARCCKKPICTECYFSIRPPSPLSVCCPFCQQPNFITSFTGPLSIEERKKIEEEDAKVKALEEKMRLEEIEKDLKRKEEKLKASSPALPLNTGKEVEALKDDLPPLADEFKDDLDVGIMEGIDPSKLNPEELEELMLNEAIRLSLVSSEAM